MDFRRMHKINHVNDQPYIRMTRKLSLFLFFILGSTVGLTQPNIQKFSPRISYVAPDKAAWTLIKDELNADQSKGVIMFKHTAIKDSKGRSIEPGIIVNYERVKQKLDPKQYSVKALYDKKFKPNREYLGGYPLFSSDRHAAVYKGNYTRDDIKHSVVLGYLLFDSIGIEIIGDATEEVFPTVKAEMLQFIKTFRINEQGK